MAGNAEVVILKQARKAKQRIGLAITLVGVAIGLLALSAGNLGIDRDKSWGPARRFLLYSAITLVLLPHLSKIIGIAGQTLGAVFAALGIPWNDYLQNIRANRDLGRSEPQQSSLKATSRRRVLDVSVMLILGLAVCVYTWLISVGRWSEWIHATSYYHLLADGFRSGQSALALDPPTELSELADPYEVEMRRGFTYLWDASYFDGKYYLYWGPTPGFLAIAIETIFRVTVADRLLVWIFALGCAGFLLLLLRKLWIDFLADLPWWTFIPVALLAVFISPLPWLMTRPAVYEAAIAGGQFFFLGGLFWLMSAMSARRSPANMFFLAGLFWALAVGSRVTLAIPVIGIVLIMIAGNLPGTRDVDLPVDMSKRSILALVLPLVLGAALLAFYNYDRFGSILELGHRFQLGRTNKLAEESGVISLMNIPQNLFNYLFNPYRRIEVFPFIKPRWGDYSIPFLHYSATDTYHTEQVAGVLLSTPFLWFGIWPFLRSMRCHWKNLGDFARYRHCRLIGEARLREVFLGIWVAAGLTFIPLLLLRVNSMRHELDFVPVTFLASAVGYASMYRRVKSCNLLRKLTMVAVWVAVLVSITLSLLLAVTGYSAVFENLNPQLFDRLVNFFMF